MSKINSENIIMVIDSLETIPDFTLPAEFNFSFYTDGDIDNWLNIQNQSDEHSLFTEERFYKTYNNDIENLKDRLIFISTKDGKKIATSTAWYEDKDTGLVHWVAVIPEYQGQSLSMPLLSHTLKQIAKRGHKKAMLRTKPFRVPAINVYLKFGFIPYICSNQDYFKWEMVIKNFKAKNIDYSKISLKFEN